MSLDLPLDVCLFLPLICPLTTFSVLNAGCSIQDELFSSFEQLLKLMDTRGTQFDRCVLIKPTVS